MTRDRFLHILRFWHFADISRRPDPGEEYDRIWKISTVFDTLNQAYLNSKTTRNIWQWTR